MFDSWSYESHCLRLISALRLKVFSGGNSELRFIKVERVADDGIAKLKTHHLHVIILQTTQRILY